VLAVALAAAALVVVARPSSDVAVVGGGVLDAGTGGHGGNPSAGPASGGPDLVVEVAGAVRKPGVYTLPPGARVGDAITAAGGYAASVDATAADRELNLAAVVKDGQEIRVPVRGEAVDPGPATAGSGYGSGSGAATTAGAPVDLNHASADQLDGLPGVGPATVAKIIAAREQQPFASVDDLATRKIVGAATLEKLRPLATVGP